MKSLEELGLSPIETEKAKEVNGGTIDSPTWDGKIRGPIYCCWNIPPTFPGDLGNPAASGFPGDWI